MDDWSSSKLEIGNIRLVNFVPAIRYTVEEIDRFVGLEGLVESLAAKL